ncbi:hypothetical protein [Sporosarcina sp. FSL K6-1508]|uniref:hypothetical protein n=1 Tax=Sporosarcina sp. FSL K6-1508 TaxID=2921553 RepID=UPI0030FC652B
MIIHKLECTGGHIFFLPLLPISLKHFSKLEETLCCPLCGRRSDQIVLHAQEMKVEATE